MNVVHAIWELLLGLDMPLRGTTDLAIVALVCIVILLLLRGLLIVFFPALCWCFLWAGNCLVSVVLWFDYRKVREARRKNALLPPGVGSMGDGIVEMWLVIVQHVRSLAETFRTGRTALQRGKSFPESKAEYDIPILPPEIRKGVRKTSKPPKHAVRRCLDLLTVLLLVLACLMPLAFLFGWEERAAMRGMVIGEWMNASMKALHQLDGWGVSGSWKPYSYIGRVDSSGKSIVVHPASREVNGTSFNLMPGQYILVIRPPRAKETMIFVRFLTKEDKAEEGYISRNARLIRLP